MKGAHITPVYGESILATTNYPVHWQTTTSRRIPTSHSIVSQVLPINSHIICPGLHNDSVEFYRWQRFLTEFSQATSVRGSDTQ